jgi:hypothetical protein
MYMPEFDPSAAVKLSVGQKMVIAGLLCLQIPSGAIFYPMATIIMLTGVGAPLSVIFWAIGTMPFSLAMKRKAEWQSGVADDIPEEVPPTGVEPI